MKAVDTGDICEISTYEKGVIPLRMVNSWTKLWMW